MPRRIVLHPGFHKTGTSTVQQFFRTNRPQLKKHLAVRLRGQMLALVQATRGYSTWRDPGSLDKAQNRFEAILDNLPSMPKRCLLVSSEELCGHLPGRGDLVNYSAAADLLYGFASAVRTRFPNASLHLYFSTRAPDDWLRSAYWEHVKSSAMTMDYDDYAARYSTSAQLDEMIDDIAARVPAITHRTRVEDTANTAFGPATPLLDLCEIPQELRDALTPPAPQNTRPDPARLLQLLDANRTYKDADKRRAVKEAILAEAKLK